MRLQRILEIGKANHGSAPCIAYQSRGNTSVLTYSDAYAVMCEHRQWLQKQLSGIFGHEIVVAYLALNSTDFFLSLLASTSIDDADIALLNTRWTPREMLAALQINKGKTTTILLYSSTFEALVAKVKAEHQVLSRGQHVLYAICIPSIARKRHQPYSPGSVVHSPRRPDSLIDKEIHHQVVHGDKSDSLIVYTSGTTSGSKGVRLSHRALWIQALAKMRSPCVYSGTTRMLASTVPLFHVGGLSSALAVLLAGGAWVFPPDNTNSHGFDPNLAIQSISHQEMPSNTLVVVPAMLHVMFQKITSSEVFLDVELILLGGQSASPAIVTRIFSTFPRARFVQTYACTEAASSMTFHPIKESPISPISGAPSGDCVGYPPPHVGLALYEKDASGRWSIISVPYKIGVFGTKGPHVMNGYWSRDGSHQDVQEPFLTNDLGFVDKEGLFYFSGRAKDVIRTGGETVIASEVERVLLLHPNIDECAVFALPDDRFGEAVCVAIVWKSLQHTSTIGDLRSFCLQHGLAGYKKPSRVFSLKNLPRNSSGKVLKFVLVDRFRRQSNMYSKL